MSSAPGLSGLSASLSAVGNVRALNEDACLEHPMLHAGLWVVADGMGGHDSGDLASNMIVESLKAVNEPANLSDLIDNVEGRLHDVHQELCEIAARSTPPTTIGSTVAALASFRRQAVCVWAGDSRVYRYRNGEFTCLTRDHSEVEELIQRGMLLPEQAENHPSANVLTSAVGAGDRLRIEVKFQAVLSGDRYLLCSDGLYRELGDDEMARCVSSGELSHACEALVGLALGRECRDNVTAVVVEFRENA